MGVDAGGRLRKGEVPKEECRSGKYFMCSGWEEGGATLDLQVSSHSLVCVGVLVRCWFVGGLLARATWGQALDSWIGALG